MTERTPWVEWLATLNGPVPLDVAAARIAAEEGSGATTERVLESLDELAAPIRFPPRANAVERVARMICHLFEEEDFHGEIEGYDEPINSCIDAVLDRRRGLPIVLSVITIEVGRRVGIPLDGVSFPGHFLVGTRDTEPRFFIDPFRRGAVRRVDELELEYARMLGRRPDPAELNRALAPTSSRDILVRMSTNLLRSWLARGNLGGALRNAERRVALRPDSPELRRDRGLLLAKLGLAEDAAGDLQHYLAERPGAQDAARVTWQLSMLLR